MVHRIQKFVEVVSGRIGYALTSAALSEASDGATWEPDASFNVADLAERKALRAREAQEAMSDHEDAQ